MLQAAVLEPHAVIRSEALGGLVAVQFPFINLL